MSDDEGIDRDAIVARRDSLKRRSLLLAAAAVTTGATGCEPRVPCLSPPPAPPVCFGKYPPLPGSTFWIRDELEFLRLKDGPFFIGDALVPAAEGQPSDWPWGPYTFGTKLADVNALSPKGIAALEELIPLLANAQLSIHVEISAHGPYVKHVQGAGPDGQARAQAIRLFLGTRGIEAKINGSGFVSSGSFQMRMTVVLCNAVEAPPP